MKNILFVSVAMIVLGLFPAKAQQFQLRGLEIYNPYYHNPAYVQAEKTVQLDLIGYNFSYNSGIWASAMTTIPKFNSSVGIRLAQGSYDGTGDFWNLQLAYAYKHSFSEDLHLHGGIQFSSGHVDYDDGLFVIDQEVLSKRHSGTLGLGVSVEYKKLHAGLSTSLPLYGRKDVVIAEDGSTETQNENTDNFTFHLLTGYSLGKPGRLTLDPIFGLDYYVQNSRQFKEMKGYLGANLEIRNLVGLGFTMGNLVSFTTSLNFMDRVSLILGIYAGEHELFGPVQNSDYTLGSREFDIIGQIRVNL